VHDIESGEFLAVLDSATVTAWRTGLAAALGTDILARPPETARTVAVIGAGAQASLVLTGLAALRQWNRLVVCDLDPARAQALAAAQASGGRRPAAVTAGTLGDVLRGTAHGRTSDAELTIYTPVGLPWQDLALAWPRTSSRARQAGAGSSTS
jgi:ornithine cyclodeaminase/alanine dehydrogenase-like protein (mu-crystallin family)